MDFFPIPHLYCLYFGVVGSGARLSHLVCWTDAARLPSFPAAYTRLVALSAAETDAARVWDPEISKQIEGKNVMEEHRTVQ